MTKVHVATPMTGTVRAEHAQFLQWLTIHERRYFRVMYMMQGRPIPDARNKIVKAFLSDPEADFLMMLDSDQWPDEGVDGEPYFNPLDLVERDLDVVTFPSPGVRYSHPDGPIIWFPGPEMPGVALANAEVIATSCIIIARRVLEHPALRVPFANVYHDDGTLDYSEDTDFSNKARAAGFRLYCAMDRPLHHAKTIDLLSLWRAQHQDSQPSGAGAIPSLPKAGAAEAAPAGKETA